VEPVRQRQPPAWDPSCSSGDIAMRTQLLMLTAAIGLVACAATEPARTGLLPEATRVARRAELKPKVEGFVNEIAALENEAVLPRWDQEVCPQVTGLSREEGEFMLARISKVAGAAGVPLADERCRPNLFIFVTTQPKELLHGMEERNFTAVFGVNALRASVDEFIDTPRPVRVWYNTASEIARGPPWIDARGLIVTPLVVSRAFVIVDRAQLQGVSVGQLADYVAMVGFAELKPAAHAGDAQTILKLFDASGQAALTGMTDWDRAFLKSLYATEQSGQQLAQIASSMVREIVPDPLEEIIVGARKEKLSELHQKIEKSEDAFYEAYNKADTEPEYKIHCGDEIPTGTRMPAHVCKPQFVDTATADEAQGFLYGYAAMPAWMVIASRMPAYEKHMREVVEKDPKLIAAVRDYYLLTKHYEAVRKEKFKGKWLVWD
jgi:hypothetical protein